ncbi:MAG: DUF4097 domain-containing protein [Streptococcaceae bacterium]|jgi:DUF4097 and DUF4098 domain-containing protein YvlB|nr:DUF4097 domain-containing protein [Streptococcaceae bacterium]
MNKVSKKRTLVFGSLVLLSSFFLLTGCGQNQADKSVQNSKTVEMSKDFNSSAVEKLRIDSGVMDVKIEEGEALHFNVKYIEERKPTMEVKDKTLNFDSKTNDLSKNDKKLSLSLTFPKGKKFADFNVKQSDGVVEIKGLKTQSLKISSGNGSITADKLTVIKASSISSGNGGVELSDLTAPGLNISVGNGDISVYGKEVGKRQYKEGDQEKALKITSGNGSIEIK